MDENGQLESCSSRPHAVAGQETIILLATPGLRSGPQSPLARLVRQFEPYWHASRPQPLIYAPEGAYREILRCGLLTSYSSFCPLPPGFRGALVHACAIVISHAVSDPDDLSKPDPFPVRVYYLIDPSDPTSVYPETAALKRDTVVAGKTFLATEAGIEEWLTLQLYVHVGSTDPPDRFWLNRSEIAALLETERAALLSPSIALVAHDKKKKHLLRFCLDHFDLIRHRFRCRYATGTTGDLLNGLPPQRPFGDIDIEDARRQLESKLHGDAWVDSQPSGPRGGDTQIARRILDRQCNTVLFFEDPHYAREHEADIQLLERTSRIPDLGVLCIHDRRSAEVWAHNWEQCVAQEVRTPATLVQAFRRLFGVELVLPRVLAAAAGSPSPEDTWQAITDMAAFYLTSAISRLCRDRRSRREVVRVGIPWGFGAHELILRTNALSKVLGALDQVTERRLEAFYSEVRPELEKNHKWPPRLTCPLTHEDFLRPGNVLMIPLVGVMGAYDRRVEANSNAARLAALMGGESLEIGGYVFYQESDGLKEASSLEAEWSKLDFLLLTGDQAKPRFGSKVFADVPDELWRLVRESAGECAGLYLTPDGRPWDTGQFRRQGIGHAAIRECARRGGSILMVGAQDRRLPVAKAMLSAGLVSTLITDIGFAWRLIRSAIGIGGGG